LNWAQLRTILWLRWRLTRNQWSRGGPLNAVITMVAAVSGLVIACAGGIAGIAGGALGLATVPPHVLLLVWDGIIGLFLFAWMIGLLTEIQRSETIDLARLLHLPVSLRDIFAVNYLASHVTFSLILFLPAMLGLGAGLMWGRGWSMGLLFPLVLAFIFMLTAWTYCLRGWLVSLMVNQRRRRAIVVGVTVVIILLSQAPNLYFNVMRNWGRPGRGHPADQRQTPSAPAHKEGKLALPAGFLAAHRYVPPLWVGGGALGLARGDTWPALGGALAAFILGALGLGRAYQSTVRFYQGNQNTKAKRAGPTTPAPTSVRKNFLERQVPGVSEEAGALALAFLRSMSRAPEVKMALAVNVIMPVVFAGMILSHGPGSLGEAAKPFVATGAVAVAFLSMLQVMFNQFGFDREGFRALVLLPVARRQILLAKNLAFLPIGGGLGLVFLAVVEAILRVSVPVLLAACCQLGAMFLLVSLAGNFVSVMAPYRIGVGSLKPTKAPAKTMAVILVSHMLFPLAVAPIFVPPGLGLLSEHLGWLPAGPVNLLLSLLWLAAMSLLYWLSLESGGRFLQRREKEILQRVTHEVE
jgi:ABC-2 type transport system permease protein